MVIEQRAHRNHLYVGVMVKEVRRIHGGLYLYENSYVWDRAAQRSRKVNSVYLGP